jgi:hypothetical protein
VSDADREQGESSIEEAALASDVVVASSADNGTAGNPVSASSSRAHTAAPVRVLIEDPDLSERLSDTRLRQAVRTCLARVVRVPRGP